MLRRWRVAARLSRGAWRSASSSSSGSKGHVPPAARPAAAFGLHLGGGETGQSSLLYRHGIPLAMWTVVSLNVGAFFSSGDEGVQILLHMDEFTEPILSPDTKSDRLTERLERVARGAPLNDSLKLALAEAPRLIGRLMDLADGTAPGAQSTARNHAAKTLEYICSSPEAARCVIESGEYLRLVNYVAKPDGSLYRRKMLGSAVCNLAQLPEAIPKLGAACAVGALHDLQNASASVRRQKVTITLQRLATSLLDHEELLLASLPEREQQLISEYAEAEAEAAKQPLHTVRSTLIESGVLLYLHTAAGGAAWGLFESLREGVGRAALVQNVVRTSLVTCFVPILLVGGVVSAYNRFNKATDSVQEKFYLYFAASMAMYPSGRLLQWVESFAPLWLGGHIVGFASFFTWTLYTESDLLKNDRDLQMADQRKR